MLTWMIAILARKKTSQNWPKKHWRKWTEIRGALVCLFVRSFVRSFVVVAGGRVTVGERGGRMCLCSVVVVVATALLTILHRSTTPANLSFVVSNKSTTILFKSFSFCSASRSLYSFLVSLSFVAQAKGGGSSCDWGRVRFQFMVVVERF